MKVLICDTEAKAAHRAAELLIEVLQSKPRAVLGLATGETMRSFYTHLVAQHSAGRADFGQATSFNLDEYVGLAPDHPGSFHAFMQTALFDHVNLAPARAHLPRGNAPDPQAEAERYEGEITAAGGIDIQLLGIGRNGHLAFNEPTSSLGSRTRIKTLTEATRAANASAFAPEDMPRQAITMGIANILDARACVMLATGAAKAAAVARMIEGPIGADCPATALQFHPAATIILDPAAAASLSLTEYYEAVHSGGAE